MARADLAGIVVGDGHPVAVMAAINVSPESFYAGSVAAGRDALRRAAEAAVGAGAAIVDVGARSTAPYGAAPGAPELGEAEEADRLGEAVHALARTIDRPVSADTRRAGPARAALEAGAQILNDAGGLLGEPRLAALVARHGAGLVIMAAPPAPGGLGLAPVDHVGRTLAERLALATGAGVAPERIVIDPGIGFFRDAGMPWHVWDCRVLASLPRLAALGRPVCVGVSRKSFIDAVAGVPEPGDRLPGSLAAAAAAVLGGAALIRAHDVAETLQAVRVAEALARAAAEAAGPERAGGRARSERPARAAAGVVRP